MGSALGSLVAARLKESLRHPETIFWTFVFPALLAVALGIAFRAGPGGPLAVAVAGGEGAPRVAQALSRGGELAAEVLPRDEGERRLRSGRAVLLVVPGDPLVYRFDPTRPESLLARERADRAVQEGAGRGDAVATADERVTAPGSRYIDFLVPGLLGMNLMGGGLWGIGWTIVEERIRKLLKLQLATPMSRRDYLLSHVIARFCFVPLEVIPLLLLAGGLFRVSPAGPASALAAVAAVGAASFAGIGLLVASRARTTATISGLINLATFPMIVLSGVFFSTSRFPEALRPLIDVLPLTALVDALRAVMNEGATLAAAAPDLLVLAAWGAASFAVALRIFRWT